MLMHLEPFSLVDYPGHIAATVFFGGCNYRCGYCHNPSLVNLEEKSRTSPQAILDFLRTRKGLLDGVCLTGGEPLLSPDMPSLARNIKGLGFKVKLDTNGSSLEKLLKPAPYLDYIAVDIKAVPKKYDRLTGCPGSWGKVRETAEWVKKSGIPYEFRTTVLPAWHTPEDLQEIRAILGEDAPWVLQQFREPPQGVLDKQNYKVYPASRLQEAARKLNCQVRGL